MKNLGFTEKWPSGIPTEPWWENPEGIDVGDVWITELMLRRDFWFEIAEKFREQGRKEVKDVIRKAAKDIGL
jgi:hypothetical protein